MSYAPITMRSWSARLRPVGRRPLLRCLRPKDGWDERLGSQDGPEVLLLRVLAAQEQRQSRMRDEDPERPGRRPGAAGLGVRLWPDTGARQAEARPRGHDKRGRARQPRRPGSGGQAVARETAGGRTDAERLPGPGGEGTAHLRRTRGETRRLGGDPQPGATRAGVAEGPEGTAGEPEARQGGGAGSLRERNRRGPGRGSRRRSAISSTRS